MDSRITRSDADRGAILVTGGAGYIGSHAAKALVQAGRRVVVYDNLSAGHRGAARWCDLVVADLHDTEALRRTVRDHRVGAVMHFAALASVGDSVRDPSPYYRENLEGTLGLLRVMVEEGIRPIIFSSTAAVFGEPDRDPHHRSARHAADQPVRGDQARGRACARPLRARVRAAQHRAAVFQRGGRRSGRGDRRGPPPRGTPHPACHRRGAGRGSAPRLRRRLPDA